MNYYYCSSREKCLSLLVEVRTLRYKYLKNTTKSRWIFSEPQDSLEAESIFEMSFVGVWLIRKRSEF